LSRHSSSTTPPRVGPSSTTSKRRASRCLGTSRGSSRSSSCHSSLTTLPRTGSSSTTSPTPRVRVPRLVARLVTWLVTPLVIDYSASRDSSRGSSCRPSSTTSTTPLVVDYFALRGSSRGSSRRSSSTTPPRAGSSSTTSTTPHVRVPRHVALLVVQLVAPLVVDYFAYTACPGVSARCVARHAAHHRLLRAPRLRLAATLALLQPRRTS
jgi:hypothetical protein